MFVKKIGITMNEDTELYTLYYSEKQRQISVNLYFNATDEIPRKTFYDGKEYTELKKCSSGGSNFPDAVIVKEKITLPDFWKHFTSP